MGNDAEACKGRPAFRIERRSRLVVGSSEGLRRGDGEAHRRGVEVGDLARLQ